MDINEAFPSSYLKAADVGHKQIRARMDRVEMEDLGGDHKPVLYFRGAERGMVLNKTNATTIMSAYGGDTDMWAGKPLILFTREVEFQGKTVPGLRVRIPADGVQPEPQKPVEEEFSNEALEGEDDLPF